MPAYTASLPQYPVSFTETRKPAVLRSQMDSGAPKTRKQFTSAVRVLEWSTILNGTQKATFDTFFITTIDEGATSFTITDPVDDATITVRFIEPPQWRFAGGDVTVATRLWQATYALEVLP